MFYLISLIKSLIFFTGSYSINVFPDKLSKEEEEDCLKKLYMGDKEARSKLIEHNLRLVAHIVKKYESKNYDIDDLISIGTIGLVKGIDSYKQNKKTRLTTYAARCIENEILMYFRQQKKTAGDIYIDTPIDTDKDGNQLTLMDIIADDKSVIDDVELIINSKKLYGLIKDCLEERELEIISMRYGLFGYSPRTQKEVADKLDISRSYVSRIEKKALGKLKKSMDNTMDV